MAAGTITLTPLDIVRSHRDDIRGEIADWTRIHTEMHAQEQNAVARLNSLTAQLAEFDAYLLAHTQ